MSKEKSVKKVSKKDLENMKVVKRSGKSVDFELSRITQAINNAFIAGYGRSNFERAQELAVETVEALNEKIVDLERIQDTIEVVLMRYYPQAAKRYILYRFQRKLRRVTGKDKKSQYKLITDEFVAKYKHMRSMLEELGNFVYYRTYSRFLEDEGRREYFWETIRRAAEYNCSLAPTSKEEAEKLYDNMFNLKNFLAGRTLYAGNTKVTEKFPMANFNCAFQIIEDFESYSDLFYLLMIGSGIGLRLLKEDVAKMPEIRTATLINEAYEALPEEERSDHTSLIFKGKDKDTARITVGDSKEGWVNSLRYFFKLLYSNDFRNIETIIVNYNNIRPRGARLKTFGGTASGPESLEKMFKKIMVLIENRKNIQATEKAKLKPIDCMDIANIIGENVVSGGVRRTAEIMIIDPDDTECIEAKNNLYRQTDDGWVLNENLSHRQVSNNSIYYQEKPTREKLHWQIMQMKKTGEPAFINAEAAAKRRDSFNGVNPCGEILLDTKGLCNLTTINVEKFANEDGSVDLEGLLETQRLSARAGYRMTRVKLELPKWQAKHEEYKIIGCSLTGWQDFVNKANLSKEREIEILQLLREAATNAVNEYAEELGEEPPQLVTTVKPEGSQSQLPGVSSGVHYSHSPYFIRRVRISADDPLAEVAKELGWPAYPEVGHDPDNPKTLVIEFPQKAPKGRTKYDVSAIEQLENYKMFMEHYVDHNVSITVHVRDNEWEAVEEWMWENWDDVIAVTFLALDDSVYELLPYEEISKDEYDKRKEEMNSFIPYLLSKYEKEEVEFDIGDDGCETGVCPIR